MRGDVILQLAVLEYLLCISPIPEGLRTPNILVLGGSVPEIWPKNHFFIYRITFFLKCLSFSTWSKSNFMKSRFSFLEKKMENKNQILIF